MFRYDSRAGAGPIGQASSQASTWAACASASEYTATVRIPRRLAVAAMRQAISPRLAIRILLNIELFKIPGSHPKNAKACFRDGGMKRGCEA